MLIPLIPKDPERNDFTCRDGEIDFILSMQQQTPGINEADNAAPEFSAGYATRHTLTPEPGMEACSAVIRIPLQSGDKPKAELMLSGEISRVDPATADRLTQAIVQKSAECLLDITTDLRRRGLFILPFRVYSMLMTNDGTLSYPTPQAVALPVDFPPHPEITAASVTEECLTLAIRIPALPHRLGVSPPANLPPGHSLRTFISYPLYIPDPKEMRGSIGSVRSATGGNATGIRFAFLSMSAVKASVAAPEKYHEIVGNERTGYRISTQTAPAPDYSSHALLYGYTPPFPRGALLALGSETDTDTDPLDWIADWHTAGEGYLPASLPYKYHFENSDSADGIEWPEGIDKDAIMENMTAHGLSCALLTRPMTLATHEQSRRHTKATSICRIHVPGIPADSKASGILYGSDDCVSWEALRSFDPHRRSLLLTPPRLFWRLLLYGDQTFRPAALALEVK
ncbi:MAG: hypothetical protein K2N48_12460 [Muribaculaceae bacterium]|nr:hypothetical protein [Muribaculaceae bacterium]